MDLAAVQRETLERRAAETGRCRDLLVYHAVQGDWAAFFDVGSRAVHEEDALARDILALSQGSASSGPDLARRLVLSEDPLLYYSLAKHLLRTNAVSSAVAAARQLLTRKPNETIVMNLVVKWLASQGDTALASRLARASLLVNPDQRDVAAILDAVERGDPLPFTLYLDAAPQRRGVTFYTPAHNVAQYLRGTIEALIGQSYPLHEILVVDDGSVDATADIARDYPVRLIAFGENRGLAAARNAAFREAATELVGAVDADVCADPDYTVHVLMEFENADPKLAGVGGRLIEIHDVLPGDRWRARHLPQGWYPYRMYFGDLPVVVEGTPGRDSTVIGVFFLNGCNTIFRRDAVLDCGGYNEKYRANNEDGTMSVALRDRGRHLAFTHSAVARHARRDTASSVAKTAWAYGFWAYQEAGLYHDAATILNNLNRGKEYSYLAMNQDISGGETECIYVGFLLLFFYPLLDLRYGVEQGFFTREQGAFMQHTILGAIRALDDRCQGGLFERVYRDTAALLIDAPFDNVSLPEETRALFDPFIERLVGDLAQFPEELYAMLTMKPAH